MTVDFKTDTGRVRGSNQDAAASGVFEGGCWGVVCDGMGGASGGDIASSCAVQTIGGELSDRLGPDLDEKQIFSIVQDAIDKANAVIYGLALKNIPLRGMGTTVVCAVVVGDTVYVSHVGDSRAYRICESGIIRLTKDHSMVQQLVDIGRITEEEARSHPQKNVITRALGVAPAVEVDHDEFPTADGDVILLCSDGLSNCVEDAEICRMAREIPIDALCAAYIDEANNNGGSDNITALVIR